MSSAIRGSSSQTSIEQPARLALFMLVPMARQSGKLPEAGAASCNVGRAVSRAVDQSSDRAASAMIDVEG
jgi:hypothetical protein